MVKTMTMIVIGFVIAGLLGMAYYKFAYTSSGKGTVSVDKQWEIEPNELERLEVQGGSTNLNVEFIESQSNQPGYVHVNGTAHKDVAQKIESAEISAHTLSLDLNTNEWGFPSFDHSERTLHVTVALPEQEMLDSVHFRLQSGNASYSDVKGRNIQMGASSGNIRFHDIEAQNISMECTSGNIQGSGITGSLQVTSKSGSVTVDELSGNSIVNATSGNVKITQKTAANTDINASSGNVTMTVAKGFAGLYDLRASSGNIKAPDSKGKTQEVVKIRTTSGNITVKEQ
ncbi:DUF4097 family beta strand repeat-containing protein [Brevibacillus sp. B_LB10_24]|uniref:DUF4097 family beta strand repeat-containing protein n=1 Tax=Brevibacillus sp. B_LB10_24 TaxID=3380645 RepID=UPI0038BC613F